MEAKLTSEGWSFYLTDEELDNILNRPEFWKTYEKRYKVDGSLAGILRRAGFTDKNVIQEKVKEYENRRKNIDGQL